MDENLSRRDFLCRAAMVGLACAGWEGLFSRTMDAAEAKARKGFISPKQAMHYVKLSGERVRCVLCPRRCIVGDRERGYCGVRENRGGIYYSMVYGNPCVIHSDPIEKKPVLHCLPGSKALTIATAGCNLNCKYCQNWQFSQARPDETLNHSLTPSEAVNSCKGSGHIFIAFDYTEPVVFYEYVYDTAKLAKSHGLRTIVASACYIEPAPLKELCPYLDVLKVDLKGFNDQFYKDVCQGKLNPVLEAAKVARSAGTWVELVNLIVPALNDDLSEIRKMCQWVLSNLGADVPLTFSRFDPMYQLKNLPPTPIQTVEKAKRIAEEVGLHYVYLGNVPASSTGRNTYCHNCKKLLIQRLIYEVRQNNVVSGKCRYCRRAIPGVWA